jgi:hypothetical protein
MSSGADLEQRPAPFYEGDCRTHPPESPPNVQVIRWKLIGVNMD